VARRPGALLEEICSSAEWLSRWAPCRRGSWPTTAGANTAVRRLLYTDVHPTVGPRSSLSSRPRVAPSSRHVSPSWRGRYTAAIGGPTKPAQCDHDGWVSLEGIRSTCFGSAARRRKFVEPIRGGRVVGTALHSIETSRRTRTSICRLWGRSCVPSAVRQSRLVRDEGLFSRVEDTIW